MKRLILLSVACLGILWGCSPGKPGKPASANEEVPSLPAEDLSAYRDTLIGKFDGETIDTLISEPYGEKSEPVSEYDVYGGLYYKWRVFTAKGTVKDFYFEGLTTRIKFVKEGDLDGDGQDEWGYLSSWPTSNFRGYSVYQNNNGHWETILNLDVYAPLINWDMEDDDYDGPTVEDLVKPTDTPGVVKIKQTRYLDDVDNDIYLGHYFVDKLVNLNDQHNRNH